MVKWASDLIISSGGENDESFECYFIRFVWFYGGKFEELQYHGVKVTSKGCTGLVIYSLSFLYLPKIVFFFLKNRSSCTKMKGIYFNLCRNFFIFKAGAVYKYLYLCNFWEVLPTDTCNVRQMYLQTVFASWHACIHCICKYCAHRIIDFSWVINYKFVSSLRHVEIRALF